MNALVQAWGQAASARRAWAPAVLLLVSVWGMVVLQLVPLWQSNPLYNYGWFMPGLVGWLWWRRSEDRPVAEPPAVSGPLVWAGVGFLVSYGLARWVQLANHDWRLVSWWLALNAGGLTLELLRRSGGVNWVRHFGFPLAFFLLALPWPGRLEGPLSDTLAGGVTAVATDILNWLHIPARQEGNLIALVAGELGVAEACSGMRSLQATLALALFLGEFYRLTLGRRGALLLGSVGVALVFNGLRVTAMGVIAHRTGNVAGVEAWHDRAGIVELVLIILAVGTWASWWHRPAAKSVPPPPRARVPLGWRGALAMGAVMLVIEVGARAWYWVHERTALTALEWTIRWPAAGTGFKVEPLGTLEAALLRYTRGEQGSFVRPDGNTWVIQFLEWVGDNQVWEPLSHVPEICGPSRGWTQQRGPIPLTIAVRGVRLPMLFYVLSKQGQSSYVFRVHWQNRFADQPEASYSRFGRLEAVRQGRRHHGVKVMQVTATGYSDLAVATRQLEALLGEVLEPVAPGDVR